MQTLSVDAQIPPQPPSSIEVIEEPPPTQGIVEDALNAGTGVRIAGTRVSLVLPLGFEPSKTSAGINPGPDFGIMIMDVPGGDSQQNTRNYTRKRFEEKGLTVLRLEEIRVDGYPGLRSAVRTPVDGTTSYQLIFGDSTFSVMAVTISSRPDSTMYARMEWALSTLTYDKHVMVGTYEGTAFRVDDRKTLFKFAKRGGPAWLYSRDGVVKDSYDDESMFLAMPLPLTPEHTGESMALKQLQGMERKGFHRSRTENARTGHTTGFRSYSAEHYGTMKGSPVLLYMHAVLMDDIVVIFIGSSYGDHEADLAAFRELIATVSKQ